MVTDEMVEKACVAYWGDKNMTSMFKGKTWEGIAKSMRAALEAALSAAEPVKPAPSVAVKAAPVEWQLVYDDGNVSRSVYTKEEAEDYERRSASVISIRPLYAATAHRSAHESSLRLEFKNLLDACIREFGWMPDAKPDEPAGNDPECEIAWGDLHRAHAALSAQVQDVAGWQPIETAPKDGTNILVWADGYQWPEVVRYEIYDDPIVEAEAGEKGYWRFSEDLLAYITHIDKDEISHWMPLPEAPK